MEKSEIAKYIHVDCDEHLKELIIKKLSEKTVELSEEYISIYAEEFVVGYYEGIAECAKNRAEAMTEIARKMKANNCSIEDIMEITGLSADVIASL